MRWGRPASMPASIAAPMSATWTWTFHSRPVGVSTPTMTRLSPRAASRSCSRATAASSVSARRYWTSLPGPGGGWCGRSLAGVAVAVRRRAGGRAAARAGSTPVTVVTRASRTRQSPAPPASTTPASRRAASWSVVRLERGAGAVGRRADDGGEIGVAGVDGADGRLGAGAGDGEEGALLRVGDRAVGGVGRLLQGGGEGRAVGRAAGRPAGRRGRGASWARIVPELPRAPRTAPRARIDQADSVVPRPPSPRPAPRRRPGR